MVIILKLNLISKHSTNGGSMFKTIVIFIGLKLVEAAGIFIAYWSLCHLGVWFAHLINPIKVAPFWSAGMLTIGISLIIFGVIALIVILFQANWKRTKELAKLK